MLIEKLAAGVVQVQTPIGPRYVMPSFLQRIYLLWMFRNFPILPPELTSGEKCWVCCQATIVRVEEQGSEFGVAAQIRHMDILPEAII